MFHASCRDNIEAGEKHTLREQQNMDDIFKSADTGGIIVLQIKEQYLAEGLRQL